ncbi:hypothetical protein [Magnetofaba australis]|uniref:Uncharacterized protein n=1 Tax=Magnetofaba australis IT-1 TaxID=1434232 RepID=A0A1Y2K8L9_9PROT|nr:hypothetical protein [Magnetofaba australis]OSM06847.1 hypothetical protein MAIT1_00279 [Magnetofaba australis IT-1]
MSEASKYHPTGERAWLALALLQAVGANLLAAKSFEPITLILALPHLGVTWLLWLGGRAFGLPGWIAACAAAPGAWLLLPHAEDALSPLAVELAQGAGAIGLLWLGMGTRRWVGWSMAAALALSAAYHHPYWGFLLIALPIIALTDAQRPQWLRTAMARGGAVLLLLVAPVAMLALQSVNAPHIWLGSHPSGGLRLLAVAAPILEEEMLPAITEQIRPMAAELIKRRKAEGLERPFSNFNWIRYGVWHKQMDKSQQMINDLLLFNKDQEADLYYRKLAWQIIAQRPLDFARWLLSAQADALITQVARNVWAQAAVVLLLLAGIRRLWRPAVVDPAWLGARRLVANGVWLYLLGVFWVSLNGAPEVWLVNWLAVFPLAGLIALGLLGLRPVADAGD